MMATKIDKKREKKENNFQYAYSFWRSNEAYRLI